MFPLSPFEIFWAPVAFFIGSPILFLLLVAAVLMVAHRSGGRRKARVRPGERFDAERIERRLQNLEAILSRKDARRR